MLKMVTPDNFLSLMYASYCKGRVDERNEQERQELVRETLDVLMQKKAELGSGEERQHIDVYV